MDGRINKKERSAGVVNTDGKSRPPHMINATECIQAVKTFEENAKDKAVIERVTEAITQKCYENALGGYTSITIGSNSFISIVRESQGVITSKGLDIIEKLVEEEISKQGFFVLRNAVGLYISWKENEKECE